MRRGRSTGTPTLAQGVRFEAIKESGCLIAHILGLEWVYAEIHHLNIGGKHGAKRRGHDFTIGLNPWSHRGQPFGGMSAAACEDMFGPSFARQPRLFRSVYGSDDQLLAIQNALIGDTQRSICSVDP